VTENEQLVADLVADYRRHYPALAAAWDNAVMMAAFAVYISDEPPVLLIDDKRRCNVCMKPFDAPFHYNEVREEWCERPSNCEACQPYVDAALRNMFDPAVLKRYMEDVPVFEDRVFDPSYYAKGGYIDFETASPTARRLTPFVLPRGEAVMPKGRLHYPFVEPRHTVETKVLQIDLTGLEERVLSALEAKEEIIRQIAKELGIDYESILSTLAHETARGSEIIFDAMDERGMEAISINMPRRMEVTGAYDFGAMIERHHKRADEQRGKRQPSYLKHDPTKRNRGGRRRR
jgi:hypothetical protein